MFADSGTIYTDVLSVVVWVQMVHDIVWETIQKNFPDVRYDVSA
jgi:hypothetical protein